MIWIHLLNLKRIEDDKKVFGKMNLETLPEPDLDEAIFFRIKSSSPNIN